MTTKIKLSLWVLLMAFALFTGCNKEDQVLDPTITLDGSGTYFASNKEVFLDSTGAAVLFKVKVTALKGTDGKDLDELTVKVGYDGGVLTEFSSVKSISAASKTVELQCSTRSKEGTERWYFEVKDKDGKTASTSFTLTVKKKSTTTPTAPKEFSSLTLNNTNRFLSSSDGRIYTANDAERNSSKVDIGYFRSGAAGDNLVSPVALNNSSIFGNTPWVITWGSISTIFKKTNLTSQDFTGLDDESKIKGYYETGTLTEVINNPPGSRFSQTAGTFTTGTVVAFYNGTKYGLILVKGNGSGNNGAPTDGGASIDIKVEN